MNSLEVKAPWVAGEKQAGLHPLTLLVPSWLLGGLESTVEVKGCTTVVGCRLLATMNSVGPMTMKETCSYRPVLQPRQVESGAPWVHASLWALELLLPAVLLALIHLP